MTNSCRISIITLVAWLGLATIGWGQLQSTVNEFYRSSQAIGNGSGYRFGDRGAILNNSNVSPYLALTNLGSSNGTDPSMNYFTSVRPRLDQQERSQMQRQQFQNLQRQVSQIQSQTMTQRGDGRRRSTGHATRFHTYLNYYPGLGR